MSIKQKTMSPYIKKPFKQGDYIQLYTIYIKQKPDND